MGVYRTDVAIDPSTSAPSAVDLIQIAATNPSTFVGTLAAWNELSSEDKVKRHGSLVTLTGNTTAGDGGSGAYYNNMGTLVPLVTTPNGATTIAATDIESINITANGTIEVTLEFNDIINKIFVVNTMTITDKLSSAQLTSLQSNTTYYVTFKNSTSTQALNEVFRLNYGYPFVNGTRANGNVITFTSRWLNYNMTVTFCNETVLNPYSKTEWFIPTARIVDSTSPSKTEYVIPWLAPRAQATDPVHSGIALSCTVDVYNDGRMSMTMYGKPQAYSIDLVDYISNVMNIDIPVPGTLLPVIEEEDWTGVSFECSPIISSARLAHVSTIATINISTRYGTKRINLRNQYCELTASASKPEVSANDIKYLTNDEVTLFKNLVWSLPSL